jgi:Na+-translocating ferredoxin:NAD+ oxidoreductase RnfD subunit
MTLRFDPRLYQIAVLSGLLAYGWAALGFDISPARAALLLGTCLATQFAWILGRRLPAFDARSALISGLSLCLLCRTSDPLLAAAAATIAISSKFLVRIRGKHVFNPTNIGLAVMLLLSDGVWVSPGQWGNPAWFAFLMAGFGFLVVTRAARADVTLAFLCVYAALVAGRSYWLGEPSAIPILRFQSGALLLFAFFMISDPKTTPNSRVGRVVFAAMVAFGAWYIQFRMFRTNGLLWSLAACSIAVPLIDWLLPGDRYDWARQAAGRAGRGDTEEKGAEYETVRVLRGARGGDRLVRA